MSLRTPAALLWITWGLAAITVGAPTGPVARGLPVGLTANLHESTAEMCSKPPTLAGNCSNSTMERYYFEDAQCISFQACNTDPDNVTTFETKEACQINCQAPSCTLPPKPSNGSYLRRYQHTTIPPYVYLWYSCDTGFKLIGAVSRVCLHNNTWSAPEPLCKPVTCPMRPVNSRILFSQCTEPGCYAIFYCPSSMTQLGKPLRTCKADGTWSSEIDPYCARMYITSNGKERTSLTIHTKSTLQLYCGIDPYLPQNVAISWTRVQNDTGVRKVERGVMLNFPVVRARHAGDYTCIMHTKKKILLTKSITISIKETADCMTRPVVYIRKPYFNFTVGNKLIIECRVQSCSKTSLKWYFNNTHLVAGEGVSITDVSRQRTAFSRLTIYDANPTNHSGVYICEANDNVRTTRSAPVIPDFSNVTLGVSNVTFGVSGSRRERGARHANYFSVSSRASVATDKTITILLGRLVGQFSISDTKYIYKVAVNKMLSADGTSLDPIINIMHNTPLDIPRDRIVALSVTRSGSFYSLLSAKTLTEHQLTQIQTD